MHVRISRQEIENVSRVYRIEPPAESRRAERLARVDQPAGDQVTISRQARLVQELRQRIEAEPDVRADKVAELRAAIQQGKYRVDSRDIADKMLGRILADRLK